MKTQFLRLKVRLTVDQLIYALCLQKIDTDIVDVHTMQAISMEAIKNANIYEALAAKVKSWVFDGSFTCDRLRGVSSERSTETNVKRFRLSCKLKNDFGDLSEAWTWSQPRKKSKMGCASVWRHWWWNWVSMGATVFCEVIFLDHHTKQMIFTN